MDDVSRRRARAGPELGARRTGRSIELDELNAGARSDPHGDRAGRGQGAATPRRPARREAEIEQAAQRFDPRDDADPHLSGARPSRRRSRSARPVQARDARRPHARIPRLHRRARSIGRSISAARSGSRRRPSARSSRSCARNYCGKVGLEYMHINDLEERRFLQERMEGKDAEIRFTPEGKKAILDQGRSRASSGRSSSPANMSAPSASASTAAKR